MSKIIRFKRPRRLWHRKRIPPPPGYLVLVLALAAILAAGYFKPELSFPQIRFDRVIQQLTPSLSTSYRKNRRALPKTIEGRASVIDGDTIEVHGTRIRLYGIDAPESIQLCYLNGKTNRCGQRAAIALANKIGNHVVTCEPKDRDRYNRVVAVCHAQDTDLNAWMVRNGWALAYRQYSTAYVSDEKQAKQEKVGIWQGNFTPPWEWRHGGGRSQPAITQAPDARSKTGPCLIKGNINRRGEHIYHVPGDKYYERTIITASRGERWFCTESEAQAAGWRRARW